MWDVEGRTVLPGLIDAHVHLSMPDPVDLPPSAATLREGLAPYANANAAAAVLGAGFTTVRDVGGYRDDVLVLREAVGANLCPGPRILACGQVLSSICEGARTFPGMYMEVTGPSEMRKAVRQQAQRGADFIKVMSTGALTVEGEDVHSSQLTLAELQAAVDEAHSRGMAVASHAEGLEGIRLSIAAGVDSLEHGEQLHRAPELIDEMARREIVLVPTLSIFEDVAAGSGGYSNAIVERGKELREDAYETVASGCSRGVPIASGFDTNPHGANAQELVRLVDAGLSAPAAIVAATSLAAKACRLDDIGTLCPASPADLLVVDGDPLEDIGVLADPRRIWLVIQGGRPVSGQALAGHLTHPLAAEEV